MFIVSTKNVNSIRKNYLKNYCCLLIPIIRNDCWRQISFVGTSFCSPSFTVQSRFKIMVQHTAHFPSQWIPYSFLLCKSYPFFWLCLNQRINKFKTCLFFCHKRRQDHLHNHDISDKMKRGILPHSKSSKDFKMVKQSTNPNVGPCETAQVIVPWWLPHRQFFC